MTSQSAIHNPESAIPTDLGLHPMSREGRRQAIVLLLGVLSIAVFALWSVINILQDGVSGVEWVSGLLMLAILLVTPLVAWTLLEEAQASVQADDKGITYKTAGGITLAYPWSEVTSFQQKTSRGRLASFFLGDDKDAAPPEPAPGVQDENVADEEPGTLLLNVHTDPSQQIANPLVRFLHRQAYGVNLPIHGGLETRQQLIEEIKNRTTA